MRIIRSALARLQQDSCTRAGLRVGICGVLLLASSGCESTHEKRLKQMQRDEIADELRAPGEGFDPAAAPTSGVPPHSLEFLKRREVFLKKSAPGQEDRRMGSLEWRTDQAKNEYIFVRDRNHRLIGHITGFGATYLVDANGESHSLGTHQRNQSLELLFGVDGEYTTGGE